MRINSFSTEQLIYSIFDFMEYMLGVEPIHELPLLRIVKSAVLKLLDLNRGKNLRKLRLFTRRTIGS